MKTWPKQNPAIVVALAAMPICLTLGSLLFYIFFADKIIESMHKGESLDILNDLIQDRHDPLDYHLWRGRLLFSRMVLIGIVAYLIAMGVIFRRKVRQVISDFFSAEAHPVNLAIFRLVLFGTIFYSVWSERSLAVLFSNVPAELRVAPVGLGSILPYLPINEAWASVSTVLLLIFSFTGMIGLFTRTSAFLTVIFGFYVLGIPQFFGKVNHYHHLLWFPAILAGSRCGDVFSCDAIFAAWKRADRGDTDPPGSSVAYGLPLRFVWLLMGIIYFFPGFWKFWRKGFAWALSENVKFYMYSEWHMLGGWTPIFRIDQYPIMYQLGGIGTILFEVSFIFLIFSARTRIWAFFSGLAFHNITFMFMRISFWSLQTCYVAFLNWDVIFQRIGRWLYKKEMYVVFDGSCSLCRRTVASLRVVDVLQRVSYVDGFDKEQMALHGLQCLDEATILSDMQAIVQNKRWSGFAAYRALAWRMPVLWPALPFAYALRHIF